MTPAPAVSFEHVSKIYRAPREGIHRRPEGVRALTDVSFVVEPGESLAIVGSNGAGKSTCLRLAARLTAPTSGRVRTSGRVAALVAIGSGLHPELTGRENVELYAQILGMRPRELRARLDQILAFADIGDALDRPVKTYSSGMALRLGFAVSVHVDPDVLLIDEAIAVGDLAFQDRCAERIRELQTSGCTIVLVSHALGLAQNLCQRALLLENGAILDDGAPEEVVDRYQRSAHELYANSVPALPLAGSGVDLISAALLDDAGVPAPRLRQGQPWSVRLEYHAARGVPQPHTSIGLLDEHHGFFLLLTMLADGGAPESAEGRHFVECHVSDLPIRPGRYTLWASVRDETGTGHLFPWQPVLPFSVEAPAETAHLPVRPFETPLSIAHHWIHG